MRKQFLYTYEDIISIENLLSGWREFVRGKNSKKDVQDFALHLADHIVQLHRKLATFSYRHDPYQAFNISDPKPRNIHKATVRDRVLHHAVYRRLYPFFDQTFIADSFSCRLNKGTHKAQAYFRKHAGQVSQNETRTCWVLKCDIRKFFASIDHDILLSILAQYIPDLGLMVLLEEIIDSFEVSPGKGLPLGNLTSQIFCNVYMNELDQFVKHKLKVKHYVRYADDFVLLSENREDLVIKLSCIENFLKGSLKLALHPNKIRIQTFASGVDFLGWTHFSTHQVVRTTTKRRMLRRVREHPTNETLQSYLGMLKHGNSHTLTQIIMELYNYRQS